MSTDDSFLKAVERLVNSWPLYGNDRHTAELRALLAEYTNTPTEDSTGPAAVMAWVDRAVADMDAKTEAAGCARIAWKHCGRGICAAESGHAGTCDEASGWADEWDAEAQSAPPRPVDRMTT